MSGCTGRHAKLVQSQDTVPRLCAASSRSEQPAQLLREISRHALGTSTCIFCSGHPAIHLPELDSCHPPFTALTVVGSVQELLLGLPAPVLPTTLQISTSQVPPLPTAHCPPPTASLEVLTIPPRDIRLAFAPVHPRHDTLRPRPGLPDAARLFCLTPQGLLAQGQDVSKTTAPEPKPATRAYRASSSRTTK